MEVKTFDRNRTPNSTPQRNFSWSNAGVHAILIVAVLLIGFPLIFAAIKATQSSSEVTTSSFRLGSELWNNITDAWNTANLGIYMRNSFIITVAVTLGKTTLSLLSGLAFAYFRFPFSGAVFGIVLFSLMLPADLMVLSLFKIISDFNFYNTYWAVILPFLASATGTFVFRQHFLNIPTSLADAAKIDGATPLRFLWGILIPMSYNTIGAFAVIQFVYVWDQYLWPLVAIRDTERQVIQVGLRSLIATSEATRWEVVMAGAWISLIPPLLLFIFLQEQFSRGFALSDDK